MKMAMLWVLGLVVAAMGAGCAAGVGVKPATPGLEAPTFAVQGTIPGDRAGDP